MNVLVFTTLYPNNVWPTHNVFIKERIKNIALLNNCKIKIIAPVPYYPPIKIGKRKKFTKVKQYEKVNRIDVFHPKYLITPKIGMGCYGYLLYYSVLKKIKKINMEFPFDVIDAHYVYPDGTAAILLGNYFNKPVIITARGSDVNQYKNFATIKYFLKTTLNRAAHVVAVSNALKKEILKLGIRENKITVIANGVDHQKFYKMKRDDARKILKLPLKKKIVLSIGRLEKVKNYKSLIKAFNIARKRVQEELLLIIVGEGTQRKKLEKLIQSLDLDNCIALPGPKMHDQLIYWYNSANLFCLTSNNEGWPNVLMESIACGTPVVGTAVGGVPEIINSGKIGILTERKENNIADAIEKGLRKCWNYIDFINFTERNAWRNVADKTINLYKNIAISHSKK